MNIQIIKDFHGNDIIKKYVIILILYTINNIAINDEKKEIILLDLLKDNKVIIKHVKREDLSIINDILSNFIVKYNSKKYENKLKIFRKTLTIDKVYHQNGMFEIIFKNSFLATKFIKYFNNYSDKKIAQKAKLKYAKNN